MIAVARAPWRSQAAGWAACAALIVALSGVVGARAVAISLGLDPLGVGLAFGAALMAIATLGRRVPSAVGRPRPGSVVGLMVGLAVGVALAIVPLVAASIGGATHLPGLGRPAAPFVPWALITLAVAAGEEGILRGALLDRLERVAGLAFAVAVTSAAFALMHVPVYGWHVVPLDLAVGLVLAGLRLSTRTLAAPIAAHAVADLATWWL